MSHFTSDEPLAVKQLQERVSEASVPEVDTPLPGTLRFVFTLGVAFLIGWFALFALLTERW